MLKQLEQGVIMNRLDLIIDALENSEPTGTGWVHVHEQKHQAALAAARELIAQPEQKLIGWKDGEPQYVAQPEQEPVAWMDKNGVPSTYKSELYNIPLQKLVECNHKRYSYDVTDNEATCRECGLQGRMVFVVNDTAPPKRKWIGLTEEEIKKIMQRWRGEFDIRDIERLLKEKNT